MFLIQSKPVPRAPQLLGAYLMCDGAENRNGAIKVIGDTQCEPEDGFLYICTFIYYFTTIFDLICNTSGSSKLKIRNRNVVRLTTQKLQTAWKYKPTFPPRNHCIFTSSSNRSFTALQRRPKNVCPKSPFTFANTHSLSIWWSERLWIINPSNNKIIAAPHTRFWVDMLTLLYVCPNYLRAAANVLRDLFHIWRVRVRRQFIGLPDEAIVEQSAHTGAKGWIGTSFRSNEIARNSTLARCCCRSDREKGIIPQHLCRLYSTLTVVVGAPGPPKNATQPKNDRFIFFKSPLWSWSNKYCVKSMVATDQTCSTRAAWRMTCDCEIAHRAVFWVPRRRASRKRP